MRNVESLLFLILVELSNPFKVLLTFLFLPFFTRQPKSHVIKTPFYDLEKQIEYQTFCSEFYGTEDSKYQLQTQKVEALIEMNYIAGVFKKEDVEMYFYTGVISEERFREILQSRASTKYS